MDDLSWLTARPIAHRGLHDARYGIIENTSSAIAAAIGQDYAIEVDLQLSRDGEAMVFHDATLERLTQGCGPVVEKTARQLQHAAFRATSDRMQTLNELLEQAAGRTTLILEIKSQWDNVGPLERRIAECLGHYDGPAAVMSFDPRSVAAVHHVAPWIARGLVAERFTDSHYWRGLTEAQKMRMRHLQTAHPTDAQFIAFDVKALPTTATETARRAWGLPLLTWTVRTGLDRMRAARWADQIIFEGFRP